MKKILFLAVTLLSLTFMSCDSEESIQQRKLTTEAFAQVGMPAIKNFQEKKLAKKILELRDQQDLICYAYLVTLDGKFVFIGKCIGYGLPYSTQYTNPEKYEQNGAVLSQQDPNGLYMPDNVSATWVMLINPETNKPEPTYIEQDVFISPFPMQKQ